MEVLLTGMEGAAALHWALLNRQSIKPSSLVTYSREAAGSANAVCTDEESPATSGDQYTRVRDINTLTDTLDGHL